MAKHAEPSTCCVPPLVELTGLGKHYRIGGLALPVLRNITLSIASGEFVAIMGASGSGKSTLLNIIGCLDEFNDGHYRFAGDDVQQLDADALAQLRGRAIGFVFQRFHLLSRMSALRNVEIPMLYQGLPPRERRDRAEALLEQVGLADRMQHLPTELSGGQQQRVAIARALANDPVLLIADEPTGSLDSETGREILELFHQTHAHGKAIALVTHDNIIAQQAQRIIRLADGRLIGSAS